MELKGQWGASRCGGVFVDNGSKGRGSEVLESSFMVSSEFGTWKDCVEDVNGCGCIVQCDPVK